MALSEYTNTVVGALAVASALGTQAPAIEPNTGEPQLQNPVKALMHSLRTKAGVRSFDEAVAACKRGPNKALFRVADFQKSRHSMLVVSKNDARESFWIPTSNADLKR